MVLRRGSWGGRRNGRKADELSVEFHSYLEAADFVREVQASGSAAGGEVETFFYGEFFSVFGGCGMFGFCFFLSGFSRG